VSTVPIGGGTQTVVCASPQSTLGGPIALDATSVYWADGCDTVFAAPLASGTALTLATGQNNVDAIAVDATSVYWLVNGNGGEGFVMKLPLHLSP